MTVTATSRAGNFWGGAIAVVALALCVLLLGARGRAAWIAQHTAPGLAVTSGCEEAGWFSIWRATHGLPIFADPAAPPYAAPYFNWLFYRVNATLVPEAGSGAGIVQTGRGVALVSALLGAFCLARWAWCLFTGAGRGWQTWAGVTGALTFLGPLIGWWSLTVRPDITATLAETLAVLAFLKWYRAAPARATTVAALLFYVAWSFKPNFITALAGCGMFLLLRRDWREAARLTLMTVGLWGTTMIVGGESYRAALRDTVASSELYLSTGIDNARYAASGGLHLLALIPAVWMARKMHPRQPGSASMPGDALQLGVTGLIVAGLAALVMSAKVGASRNYYFTPAMFATIALLAAMRLNSQPRLAVASALAACLVPLGVLAGQAGVISLELKALELRDRWQIWQTLPEPRFSSDLRLNVPWLNPASPPFVLAYNYTEHRRAGRTFIRGGIGGYIERGELAALLLPADTGDQYDGASLRGYQRGRTAGKMTEFIRHTNP